MVDQVIARHHERDAALEIDHIMVLRAYAYAKSRDLHGKVDFLYRYHSRDHFHCPRKGCEKEHEEHTGDGCKAGFAYLDELEKHFSTKHPDDSFYMCVAKNCEREVHGYANERRMREHVDQYGGL